MLTSPRRLASAVTAALVAAGILTSCGGTDLHSGTSAAATSEALVAVALSHLTPEPDEIQLREAGAPIDDMGTKDPSLGGLLRWKPDPDWTLDVQVQPVPKDGPSCARLGCVPLGDAELSWQEGSEDAPPAFTVSLVRGGELRSVAYEGGMEGDPRTSRLPVDLKELEEIVTDPAFSFHTTTAAVEAGVKLRASLPANKAAEREQREWEAAPVMTPRALAATVEKDLREVSGLQDAIVSGRESVFREPGGPLPDGTWGIALTLRDRTRIHVTMLPEPDPSSSACQPALHCTKVPQSDDVLAWRSDLAGVFRSDEKRNVHIWVEGPRLRRLDRRALEDVPATDPARAALLAALHYLPDDPALAWKTTRAMIRAGDELTWFHD
ncbi:hypothetical protein [Nocardioides jiangxiensis]|uniref:Uncharacterized protein n=1 Tax=Nocardioides jiangxiensis TaxID=3064524 RepID=A0ABT9B321_9ACTN|nr:hypothetical protein [Nocardioides sp. WY-20]MDO7869093.1 hypothetical protein [Nocardioides sp. WY-20]